MIFRGGDFPIYMVELWSPRQLRAFPSRRSDHQKKAEKKAYMKRTTVAALLSISSLLGAGCADAPAMGVQPPAGSGGMTGSASGGAAGTGAGAGGGTSGSGGSANLPTDPSAADVQIQIRSDADVHPISPLIYGTAQPENATLNRYALLRSGGNRMTAYNWETNASNAGNDYMFQNDNYLSKSTTPGDALQSTLMGAKMLGGTALLTIPIVDYVAGDEGADGDVRNSGTDYLMTRFKQNRATKGSDLSATPDATDDYVNQDEFVNWVKTTTAGGPPVYFALDNEPDLWSGTHAEIHPKPVTYDELCMRNVTYATMVKNVWPEAKVTGFVSYGYTGYVSLQNAPDSASKGDFIEYYLDQMKAAEATAGHRLIDYLDLHWYPEATGGGKRITVSDTTADVVAARVQAPRSLWDKSYKETSWIVNSIHDSIHLLSRIGDKITAHYPGTQLAITEWNYGGGQDISGAVAVADVLGIFGSYSVGLASYWALADETYANVAFRAYRNFDGKGAAFGDTSIQATSSDVATATVYASVDSTNPDRLVAILINKSTSAKSAGITISHPSSFSNLAVYTLTSAGAKINSGAPVTAAGQNKFVYGMPAMSVSVLVAGTAAP